MAKIPDSEYIAHLQGLDVEGRIKYLLDKAEETEKEKDRLESIIMAHIEQEHAGIEGSLEMLTERCNIHQEIIDKKLTPLIDKLIIRMDGHFKAHQAVMEAEACRKKR